MQRKPQGNLSLPFHSLTCRATLLFSGAVLSKTAKQQSAVEFSNLQLENSLNNSIFFKVFSDPLKKRVFPGGVTLYIY